MRSTPASHITAHHITRSTLLLFVAVLVLIFTSSGLKPAMANRSNGMDEGSTASSSYSHITFLPSVVTRYVDRKGLPPVLLGLYPEHWTGDQNVLDQEYHAVDSWSGTGMSLVGDFIGIEESAPEANVLKRYLLIWENGYTPFINLMTTHTAAYIASGQADGMIRNWAASFKQYANGGERQAYIAPLQEMNGNWVPYYDRPEVYKAAYRRIRSVFKSVGVPDFSVQWVFAPNGWSRVGDEFELYYPGDSEVDVVAFSSYNFGFCPDNPSPHWLKPEKVFTPYMTRMRLMAPTKPIFVAQMATTAMTKYGWNNASKDAWIRDSYTLLANQGVSGILYFNSDSFTSKGFCDLAFYKTWENYQRRYSGYSEAINTSAFQYTSPIDLLRNNLAAKEP